MTSHAPRAYRVYAPHRPSCRAPALLCSRSTHLARYPADRRAAVYAGANLPLGRYYPIILETSEELRDMDAFLTAPRAQMVLPDLFDRRPSAIAGDCIVIAATLRRNRTGRGYSFAAGLQPM
ncbi:hypothetical protein [Novosphingobium album (ex Liu et al. 2023)]|uniref:hypothetical protein n=1 Tax=Novosphingobium album (ex Liu et al. 2023) TaxID=3031130 RepID=UPI0023B02798|nr:hypothetical protein [Novosphingobium album (ex Liu et al. 2023)]